MVYRIAFSTRLFCRCSSNDEGVKTCTHCLGTSRLAAMKSERVIVDTTMEREKSVSKGLGMSDEVSVRIFSSAPLFSGEFIAIDDTGKEVFKVGTVFKERFEGGDIEAYIAGAVKTNELTMLRHVDFKPSDVWRRL